MANRRARVVECARDFICNPDRDVRCATIRLIMSHIAQRMQAVNERISRAATAASRDPRDIRLLAVSKTFPIDAIVEASTAGQRAFGENYVQEALDKIDALRYLPGLEWHMIGPLQSNKCGVVASRFSWVHTVDRTKIAARLSAMRPESFPPLQVCVQVNISGESSKSGVRPDDAMALSRSIASMPRITLRGLMGIAGLDVHPDVVRGQFRMLRELRDDLVRDGHSLDTLSMGMSGDLDAAIAEGATLVRVGSAIFGERDVKVIP